MRRKATGFLLAIAVAFGWSSGARAVLTEDDFYIRNAGDLIHLCAVSVDDHLAREAIHFCHGFVSGAWQYYKSASTGGGKLVCPSDPPPTRNQAVGLFVTWAKTPEHATYMQEPAVDVLFRFLIETWPCPKPAAEPGKKQ
jgi:hypothetical protein